jgi:hypothetical protein
MNQVDDHAEESYRPVNKCEKWLTFIVQDTDNVSFIKLTNRSKCGSEREPLNVSSTTSRRVHAVETLMDESIGASQTFTAAGIQSLTSEVSMFFK